jgi:hypothetical protein
MTIHTNPSDIARYESFFRAMGSSPADTSMSVLTHEA